MRILIFHGYLLGGTGSNVYNARLAEALVGLGHEVHLLCQERHPERHAFVTAAGDWDSGSLTVRSLGSPTEGGCTVYRPNIGTLLPVYVADRYEGLQARTFAECDDEQIAAYLQANVEAVREVSERVRPEAALANHLVMGPVILARGLGEEVPYAVKVHGSALEYTVKPHPERFLAPAREGLARARTILVGSRHTAESLWGLLGDPEIVQRTRLGPPGVDVARFAPREPAQAAAGVRDLAARLAAQAPGRGEDDPSAFARDEAAAAGALQRLDPEGDALVAFVGKLIVSKGIDLLLASWPLVLEQVPKARLVVVGFGSYRAGVEELLAALQAGDMERAKGIARSGRSLEGEGAPERPLVHLLAFLESLRGEELDRYQRAARFLGEKVVLDRPPRSRGARRPAPRLPRPGGPQHVSRGLRHGRRRGRRLRRPARMRRPLRAGRGHRCPRGVGAPAGRLMALLPGRRSRGEGSRRGRGGLAAGRPLAARADPVGSRGHRPRALVLAGGGPRRDRRGPGGPGGPAQTVKAASWRRPAARRGTRPFG